MACSEHKGDKKTTCGATTARACCSWIADRGRVARPGQLACGGQAVVVWTMVVERPVAAVTEGLAILATKEIINGTAKLFSNTSSFLCPH